MDRVHSIVKRMNESKFSFVRKCLHLYLRVVYACDIMPGLQIGRNAKFAHSGLGVVINPSAVIGDNVYIGANVIIGGRSGNHPPHIGNNVLIGGGAILIGPITIGDNVSIGAGSVVVKDVPSGCVVVGNPARIVKRVENSQ